MQAGARCQASGPKLGRECTAPLRQERLHRYASLAASVPAAVGFAMITNPQISATCPVEVCPLHKLVCGPDSRAQRCLPRGDSGIHAGSSCGSGCSSRGCCSWPWGPAREPEAEKCGKRAAVCGAVHVSASEGTEACRLKGSCSCTGHSHSYMIMAALNEGRRIVSY